MAKKMPDIPLEDKNLSASKVRENSYKRKQDDSFKSMTDDTSDDKNKGKEYRSTDAVTWQTRFDVADKASKDRKKKWADWYEQMYAIKTYKNIGMWRSKMFIPVISYKAWTIIARLLALRPGFAVKIFDELYSDEDRKYIEKANLKLEHDYNNPMLDETIRDREFDIFTDAVVCGTGYGKVEWASGTRTVYKYFQRDDGIIDYGKAEKTEIDYGYNDVEPVDPFDVYDAPGRRAFEKKPWYIIKYKKSKYDLLSSGLYDEAQIERLKPVGKFRDEVDKLKESRDQFIDKKGSEDADDTLEYFNIFECYEKTPSGTYLIVFAEANEQNADGKATDTKGDRANWIDIRNEKQPYWHGKYTLVPAYVRRKPHQSYGESIFEVTESMANGYNDIVNQLADNLSVIGNGGILMHETSTTIYDFYYAPGGEVRYSGTKPEFETPTSPDIQIFTTMLNLIDAGVTNATVSPYATGTPNDTNDQTQGTAAGINALQEAAGEITSFMKGSIMQFLRGVGTRWLYNNQQFFDDTLTVQTSRYGKKKVYRITSDDFLDSMILTIDEATMEPVTKQQKREDDASWVSSLSTIQDRSITQVKLQNEAAAPPMIDTGEIDDNGQPVMVPDPASPPPKPASKPIMIDWQKVAAEVNEAYDKPDIEEFLLDETNETADGEETDNSGMIEAVRQLVKDGDIDGNVAQAIIDRLEGRTPTMSPEISLEGDENATSTTNQTDSYGDARAAAGQAQDAAIAE